MHSCCCTGVGRCNYSPDQTCDYGGDVQRMEHIINKCPMQSFWEGLVSLHSAYKLGSNLSSQNDIGTIQHFTLGI